MSETDTSCAIGLDVGGTKIAAGIVTFPSGTVHTKTTKPTRPQNGGDSVLETVREIAQSLIDISTRKNMHPVGIGIGVAELVDLEGNVTSGHTINWVDVPVQAILEELSPTTVDADVRVAALGEARYGMGVEHESFGYVSVGTGIGSTLVQNGLPYGGARGNALIMGSSPLSTICTECGSQLHPVLEDYSSGPAIVRRYKASGGKADKAQDVFRAALSNDQSAIDILVSAADSLGVSVAFLVNVLDPHAVIVGGGLGSARGIYFDRFVTSTRGHIWSTTNRNLPILQSHLGADAGMVGAATRAYLEFA
jgi:predicted NBD/HSP70 family sugar kinase